ncbi:SigE family RNA polymerase sigma factor [Glycomyces dulcitolivorans]|uniref:SigE family RNA polymerase sigma factor n=1 Tax=Glycomyces dulcitolivorans TaxID=2200759 RepID=UPI0018E4E6BD|nr:SigE family RNA polymerase sigma factor [Glycomyces dulcitolivorans]
MRESAAADAPPDRDRDFTEWAAAKSRMLLRSAYLLTGNWTTAEDLVQLTLTKTYLAWDKISSAESIDSYTKRILFNTNASWWRKRTNHERPTDYIRESGSDRGSDFTERGAIRDAMWRHVTALPKRQRAILVLRYYEHRTDAEIAEILGISVGTVKSQSSRALAGMRKRFESPAVALGLVAPSKEEA